MKVDSGFQHETGTKLFQLIHAPGDLGSTRTVTLKDLTIDETNSELAQPVGIDRLVLVEMLSLTRPHDERAAIFVDTRRGKLLPYVLMEEFMSSEKINLRPKSLI